MPWFNDIFVRVKKILLREKIICSVQLIATDCKSVETSRRHLYREFRFFEAIETMFFL